MASPEGPAKRMEAIHDLLQQRYEGNPESAGIAVAAADETRSAPVALDEFALAWHAARALEADAAAALSGAIAAVIGQVADEEIARRTGLPLETIRKLDPNR